MQYKKLVACSSAVLLAFAVACSQGADTPVTPSGAQPGTAEAGPAGETLKASAPSPQSPVNNAQPDLLSFTAGKSTARFESSSAAAYTYEFEVRNQAANQTVCSSGTVGGGSGSSVTWTPTTCNLNLDTPYTWRVRATYQGASGPWSSDAAFRSPLGGYNNGSELYDPLTNGKTVGDIRGPVTFTGEGARLNAHDSHIRYQFPNALTTGEFSVMIKGADEGAPGDKTKVFAMQRGDDSDITTNSYRFTAELRGSQYVTPGTISCRMITGGGDNIVDCHRDSVNFDSARWYFWRARWTAGGTLTLDVKRDGPNGPSVFSQVHSLRGRTYAPTPHNLYLGTPIGRAGPIDATLPGGIYKNLWVSARPRPAFPGE